MILNRIERGGAAPQSSRRPLGLVAVIAGFLLSGCHAGMVSPQLDNSSSQQLEPATPIAGEIASRPAAALYAGASFAGTNNPNGASGEEDNIGVAIGGRYSIDQFSLRPEWHWGELATVWSATATFDFDLFGEGPGSIDGHFGAGYSVVSERENHVLGNTDSVLLRLGAEATLTHNLLTGAALLVAPTGYDDEDFAVAGVMYYGFQF